MPRPGQLPCATRHNQVDGGRWSPAPPTPHGSRISNEPEVTSRTSVCDL